MLILVIMTWFSPAGVCAGNRYLTFGTGYAFYKIRNLNMSPLLYSGHSIFSDFGYLELTNKTIGRLDVFSWFGRVKPTINPFLTNSNVTLFRLDVDYMYLHSAKIWKERDLNLFLGGAWTTRDAFRLHNKYYNNGFDFDVISSLNVAMALRKSFLFKDHPVGLTYHLRIPFISYMLGPSYSYVLPEGYLSDPDANAWTFLRSGEFVSFGSMQRLNSMLDITYYIHNGNAFKLSYHWDYTNNTSTNQIVSANHGLTFSTLFKF